MDSVVPPENKVCILLPVWGEKFIVEFLSYGLPSLLALGNLPALAAAYSTQFVILTQSNDIETFENHKAFSKLKTIATVAFITIDDLILPSNHSTTLTYAYDRGIKQKGNEMLHTYFILLNADYIMADGSLQGLVQYMRKGYSAICAGNFQVIDKEIKPFLKNHLDATHTTMSIKPRALLAESLQCLHPVTLASFLNQNNLHNYRANRFFLRESRHVLTGRFYLLHVLCIKPETTAYEVGASFDYSFVPEMCPSGNIGVINDSDDYLVIEAQGQHELDLVHYGPYRLKKLTSTLAEWTTAQHRANAEQIIYYHTKDLSAAEKIKIKAQSDQWLKEINLSLANYQPQPYRQHPYWLGAISSIKPKLINQTKNPHSTVDLSALHYASQWRKLYHRIFGYPPLVKRAHYRWPEYEATRAAIQSFIGSTSHEKVIVYCSAQQVSFLQYCQWLSNLGVNNHYYLQDLNKKPLLNQLAKIQYERCILFAELGNIKQVKQSLELIKTTLAPQGEILISLINNHEPLSLSYHFPRKFLLNINQFVCSNYNTANIMTVCNHSTFLGKVLQKWINTRFDYNKKIRFLFYFLFGLPGTIFSLIRNMTTSIHKKGYCTYILLKLTPELEDSSS